LNALVGFNGFVINIAAIMLFICTPIWAFKQFINVIQLTSAAKHLASLDNGTVPKGKPVQKRF